MRPAEGDTLPRGSLRPSPAPRTAPDATPRPLRIIGCCGWSVSGSVQEAFPGSGSHLQRYAGRYAGVEISSSFYRHHQRATYARWAASVPGGFRFAVKFPRGVTHDARLVGTMPEIEAFLDETAGLGSARGPLLIQLPPSLAFQGRTVARFLTGLRRRYAGELVCEPRHPTWFTAGATQLLTEFQIARVAADPARVPEAGVPGAWDGLRYYRLHGSPIIYRSSYDDSYLAALARSIDDDPAPLWCIFDNTMLQAAQRNALQLLTLVRPATPPEDRSTARDQSPEPSAPPAASR